MDADTTYAKAHKMRIAARLALIRMDVQFNMKRERSFANPAQQEILHRRTLVREGQRQNFASWRGRALLLAQENIRLATKEKLALN